MRTQVTRVASAVGALLLASSCGSTASSTSATLKSVGSRPVADSTLTTTTVGTAATVVTTATVVATTTFGETTTFVTTLPPVEDIISTPTGATGTTATAAVVTDPSPVAATPRIATDPVTFPPAPPQQPPAPTAEQVRQAQVALNRVFGAGLAEDGIAGARTTAALTTFQGENGLPATGVLDDQTLARVLAASANVQLSPLKLSGKGIGEAALGEDPDATVSYLSAHFGRPTGDSGWTAVPVGQPCSVKETREVRWADLLVTFAASDPKGGSASNRRQFVNYDFRLDAQGSPPRPSGIKTDRGLKLNDPLSTLLRLYPNATYDDTNTGPFGPSYSVPDDIDGSLLTGARDVVGSIGAGVFPCGE